MLNYILLIVYMIIAVAGATFMKMGNSFTLSSTSGKIIFATTIVSIFGFLLYFCSFIMWAKLITKFNLSYAVPLTGGVINTALVILGVVLFHEKLNVLQMIGVIVIIVGIILISIKI